MTGFLPLTWETTIEFWPPAATVQLQHLLVIRQSLPLNYISKIYLEKEKSIILLFITGHRTFSGQSSNIYLINSEGEYFSFLISLTLNIYCYSFVSP